MNDPMIFILHHYDEMKKAKLMAQLERSRRRYKARKIAQKARQVIDKLHERGLPAR